MDDEVTPVKTDGKTMVTLGSFLSVIVALALLVGAVLYLPELVKVKDSPDLTPEAMRKLVAPIQVLACGPAGVMLRDSNNSVLTLETSSSGFAKVIQSSGLCKEGKLLIDSNPPKQDQSIPAAKAVTEEEVQ